MTRINAFIPVVELSDKHLLAEHREIKRIPNTIKSGKAVIKDIPSRFTLGKGHVKFFYKKLLWLHNRYNEIYQECKNRGFNVIDYNDAFKNDLDIIPQMLWLHCYADWEPDKKEIKRVQKIVNARIAENNARKKG